VLSKILASGDGSKNAFCALDIVAYTANKVSVHITAINIMKNPAKIYVESQKPLTRSLLTSRQTQQISWINSGMKPQKAVSE
jgi:hypothetical protein